MSLCLFFFGVFVWEQLIISCVSLDSLVTRMYEESFLDKCQSTYLIHKNHRIDYNLHQLQLIVQKLKISAEQENGEWDTI